MTITDLIDRLRIQIRDTIPSSWLSITVYSIGQRIAASGNIYRCVGTGTSGSSTAPSGIGTDITDGTVTWAYVGPVYDPALSDAEITQFVNDSLRTYSKYRAHRRSTTIHVLSGQATYTLPTDWIQQDYASFDLAVNPSPVIDPMRLMPFTFIATTELIARPMSYELDTSFNFYPGDLQMAISPVPNSSYDLTFDYFAYHTADSQSVTVPYMDIDNALLPGAAKAIRSIATDYAVKLQQYKVGNNIEVDNRTVATNLKKQADDLDAQFVRDIIRRPYGSAG